MGKLSGKPEDRGSEPDIGKLFTKNINIFEKEDIGHDI